MTGKDISCEGCKPFPKQALLLMFLQYESFENIVGNGEIACSEKFLLFQ